MARRMSVITIKFDINHGKPLEDDGALLYSQEYFRRKSSVSVTAKRGSCFFKDDLIQKEYDELAIEEQGLVEKRGGRKKTEGMGHQTLYKQMCVGIGLLEKANKPDSLWKSQYYNSATREDKTVSTDLKIDKYFEAMSQKVKRNSCDKNMNLLQAFRRNSMMEQTPEKPDFQRIFSKSAKENDLPQTTTNQLPDIFDWNENAGDKTSSVYTSDESLSAGDYTERTRIHSFDSGLVTKGKEETKEPGRRASISVSGLPPVWRKTEEIRKTPGRYDVRHEYAVNLEKNWYENFQRQLRMKEGDGSCRDLVHDGGPDADSFGYSNEENHKNSLFNQIRGEYEIKLSNFNRKNCDEFYSTDTNLKMASLHRGDGTECRFSKQADDKFSFDTEALLGDSGRLEGMTSKRELYLKHEHTGVMKKMNKQNIQGLCHQESNHKKKGDNDTTRLPQLTLTEIRALRLKLKKYSQFQKVKNTLKGKRRFRQIAFVVMFALHFRTILLKLRERKRKLRAKKIKMQKLGSDRNRIYSPFERNKVSSRSKGVSNDATDQEPEKTICRYEIELKRIMQDSNQLDALTVSASPCNLRQRRSSDPGVFRPKDFIITLSKLCKTTTHRRKRKCKSASQKRDVESGRFDGRTMHRTVNNSRSKTAKTNVEDTGLIAEIKQQLNMNKTTNPVVTKKKPREIVIVKEDKHRRRSLNDMPMDTDTATDLRSLLKNVDMPAKEIKIQIAERKMKRRHTRYLLSLGECKQTTEDSKVVIERVPVSRDVTRRRKWSYSLCRDVMSGVRWKPQRKKELPVYDEEILSLSSLVLKMRSCRYIRWTKRYQDVLSRLEELELSAL